MHTDLTKKFQSSFLSCEKDTETILRRLFVENKERNNLLRLLAINTPDCLDDLDNEEYIAKISSLSVKKLIDEQYVRLAPKIRRKEHDEVKSYIVISYDNFIPTSNPQFRDCTISFDIICNTDQWDIGNYRIRPLKIAGFIDGSLNNSKLSGIGTLQFLSCNELLLDENLSGYTLTYLATHGGDDVSTLDVQNG